MTEQTLRALLDGNRAHTGNLPADYFADVQSGQQPPVVSMCCSDSRVSQEGMWNVDEPGWLFAPSNIGNVVWDDRDGERVVDGNLLYPLVATGTGTVAVVGHTRCGAVTAAYRAVTGESAERPPGLQRRLDLLVPVVREGLDDPAVDTGAEEARVVDQLVEYNVRRQATFLRDHEEVPDEVDVYGFVYDFHGRYGDVLGRTYLVDHAGERDPEAVADALAPGYEAHVRSLLG